MIAYLLGLVTLPALAGLYVFWQWVLAGLKVRLGITFEAKIRDNEVSNFVLKRNIWWERSFGPVFVGGWYFERPDGRHFNRWLGLGKASGPCFMVIRARLLDAAIPPG